MAWCQEFGPQLHEHCTHPMAAEADMCRCPACGLACTGRFAGCARVWAAAPSPAPKPAPNPSPPLGDVRTALDAIRAEIEELRTVEERPPPPLPVLLPSYDDLLEVTARPRRSRWWRRHRAQHLSP